MSCNKKTRCISALVIAILLVTIPFYTYAGGVIPKDLCPSKEQIKNLERTVAKIGVKGWVIKLPDKTKMSISQEQLSTEIEFTLVSFNWMLKEKAFEKDPSYLPIIGVVKIFVEDSKLREELNKKELNIELTIPLIEYQLPGTRLEVVKPNLSSTDWAETGLFATVGEDGMTATFTVKRIGMYGLFTDEKKQYNDSGKKPNGDGENTIQTNTDYGPYGMFQVEGLTDGKYPLILVHGVHSEQEKFKLDLWKNFIDWAKNNRNFKNKFKVWRFHHDSIKPIGFVGDIDSSAKDLKNEIDSLITSGDLGKSEQIVLLAHSRGGLVSRAYMQKYGGGEKVMGLLTLATPHHGSVGAIPDWGFYTLQKSFKLSSNQSVARYIWGSDENSSFKYNEQGSNDLGWDNFDGIEKGVLYNNSFTMDYGALHTVSIKDVNVTNPVLEAGQSDDDIHGTRGYGYLDALNSDSNLYLDKIIAYGGYDESFDDNSNLPTVDFLGWIKKHIWSDHDALSAISAAMAEFYSKNVSDDTGRHYIANDGMVPLQSALFLKKDSANEPIYGGYVVEVNPELSSSYYKITGFKDFSSRVQFKRVRYKEFKNYDHLDMVEGMTRDYDLYGDNDFDLFKYILEDLSLFTGSSESFTFTHTITKPSKTTVSPGGKLGPFTITERNDGSSYYAYYVQAYIIKPDGTTVNFKQISTGLDAGMFGERTRSHYLSIPSKSELGTFTFGVKIKDTNGNLIDDDSFEFTVVSGSTYASKRSARRLKRLMRNPETQVVEEDGWKVVIVPENDR